MFNFLNSKLLPKISCNSPCSDNYEAENLISDQYASKIRGFIAYPSIKPPVEIEFELLCNINMFYINLDTTVGNQRCSGVEIFAKNQNTPYISIGKANFDTQGVIFCNSRKYSKESPPPCYNSNFSLFFFKSMAFRTFLNTSKVKVVIFRTEKSVPCIASAEIWGVPSRTCSQKTIDTLHRLMGSRSVANEATIVQNDLANSNNVEKVDFRIPDDFKDDLTYELMTIPYTLPSGKTIDKITLEKHEESEKSFGRKPCDPFTGIKFNDKLKPILNVGLKSRIDMFLLENSHRSETFGLKRSLLGIGNSSDKRLKLDVSQKSNASSGGNSYSLPNILETTPNSSSTVDDLDLLINKAKSNANFVSFVNKDETNGRNCVLCNGSFQYLYKIPCKHIYCRVCLLKICKDCKCKSCGVDFVRSDVIKCDL